MGARSAKNRRSYRHDSRQLPLPGSAGGGVLARDGGLLRPLSRRRDARDRRHENLRRGVLHRSVATALRLAEGLGTYVGGRVKALGVEKQFRTLAQECGGMNDALWSLSAVTGAAAHRETASLFDKPCLLGPLAMGKDALTGMHGATRPPSPPPLPLSPPPPPPQATPRSPCCSARSDGSR